MKIASMWISAPEISAVEIDPTSPTPIRIFSCRAEKVDFKRSIKYKMLPDPYT